MEIILGILAYLFIGGCFARLINRSELEGLCRFAWPIIVGFALILVVSAIGEKVTDAFLNIINNEEDQK